MLKCYDILSNEGWEYLPRQLGRKLEHRRAECTYLHVPMMGVEGYLVHRCTSGLTEGTEKKDGEERVALAIFRLTCSST